MVSEDVSWFSIAFLNDLIQITDHAIKLIIPKEEHFRRRPGTSICANEPHSVLFVETFKFNPQYAQMKFNESKVSCSFMVIFLSDSKLITMRLVLPSASSLVDILNLVRTKQ